MKKHSGSILISPRITEKGALLAENGAYVFNVVTAANKTEVATAIREVFKVTPRKITMLPVPKKAVMTRGTNRRGMSAGGKKAYVFLKKGDTIELV